MALKALAGLLYWLQQHKVWASKRKRTHITDYCENLNNGTLIVFIGPANISLNKNMEKRVSIFGV